MNAVKLQQLLGVFRQAVGGIGAVAYLLAVVGDYRDDRTVGDFKALRGFGDGHVCHAAEKARGFYLAGNKIAQRVEYQHFFAIRAVDPFHRLQYMRVGADDQIHAFLCE